MLATNPDILFSKELLQFLARRSLSHQCFYRVDRYDVSEKIPVNLTAEQQLSFCAEHVSLINRWCGSFRPKEELRVRLRPGAILLALIRLNQLLFQPKGWAMTRLHVNASGDFLLMARECWYRIRGYPEFKTHSHLDAYGCYLPASLGLKQVILRNPLRIYHQEHDRSEQLVRPITDMSEVLRRGEEILKSGKPEAINDENWGFADADLAEFRTTA